jgi:hypothetical protein
MNKTLTSLAIAGAFALLAQGAQAATLVVNFQGDVTAFNGPAQFMDLAPLAMTQTFEGTLALPNFENFLTGTHTIALNTNDIAMRLFNPGVLWGLEGTRMHQMIANPDFDATKPVCSDARTCGGDYNPDMVRGGQPSGRGNVNLSTTQRGEGTLTIVDGVVTGFEYSINREQGLASFDRVIRDLQVPVLLDTITVSMPAFTSSVVVGDVYFATSNIGEATINVMSSAPVPEPETYAMLLAGLGLVGLIARRRVAAR